MDSAGEWYSCYTLLDGLYPPRSAYSVILQIVLKPYPRTDLLFISDFVTNNYVFWMNDTLFLVT